MAAYSDEHLDKLFPMLKQTRLDRGLSLSQVAAAVGTSKSAVQAWENLEKCPSFRNMVKWLNAFDLKIEIHRRIESEEAL
jgi:transcriptional regulator with XRE-family HTH domain